MFVAQVSKKAVATGVYFIATFLFAMQLDGGRLVVRPMVSF